MLEKFKKFFPPVFEDFGQACGLIICKIFSLVN